MSGVTFVTDVKEADVSAIRTMVAKTLVFSDEEMDVAHELAQDKCTLKEASHYAFILARDGNKLLGYTCFGRIPLTAERYDLYWIVVDVNAQQRGIASQLLMQTEAAIRARSGKAIYAETSSRKCYLPAQRFYLKAGFVEAARLCDFYSDGDDKIIFAKGI